MNGGWRAEGLEATVDGFRLGPVDFEVPPGHAMAILGPSGAGKTTLLRTVAGFLKASAGRIYRDGADVTGLPAEARGLGYVPQGLGLLPHRTAEGNVRYPFEVRGRADAGPRARALLDRMGIAPLAHRYPAQLSGGEQQRVAIARALAAEPSLLVWDEPWQGLDVLARHELTGLLQELRTTAKVPLLVVTHDAGLAFSVADSFLVLRAGHVDARCDAATLLAHPPDAFAARFIGLDNVLERSALQGRAGGALARWLGERAGPEGVAFAAPANRGPSDGSAGFRGRVVSLRPEPSGLAAVVDVDGLPVTLRWAAPASGPAPAVGAALDFRLDPEQLHPLGRAGATP